MRFLTHIVTLTIAIVVIWFAITNRHRVDLTFDPLPLSLSLPLYLPVLAGVLLGLVAGGVISWRTGRTRRARLRATERERDELQHSLEQSASKDQQSEGTRPLPAARNEPTA
jgi:uncharacterized integral membrane protein